MGDRHEARLPSGVAWRQLVGISILAGIGFTVSLFITGLAFADDSASSDAAKLGILIASVVAAAVGSVVVILAHRRSGRAS